MISTTPYKKFLFWLSVSTLVIFLDQWSKQIILEKLILYQPVKLTSFFNLSLAYNKGAAFAMLDNASGWQKWLFVAVAISVSVGCLIWLYRLAAKPKNGWLSFGLALVLGGSIGNLIDRIRLHQVVDFLDFHFNGWHFATFNIADSAICVGAALLIITTWNKDKNK